MDRKRPMSFATRRPMIALVALLAGGIGIWALAPLVSAQAHFAVFAPRAQARLEAAAALTRLFGALVLALVPERGPGGRMAWVVGGLVVLSLGGLGFGYLEVALVGHVADLNSSAYESLFVLTAAGALFAVGLIPKTPPRFGWKVALIFFSVLGVVGFSLQAEAHFLPPLVRFADAESAVALGKPLPGLTGLYWGFSVVPLFLAVAATLGVAYRYGRGAPGNWLLVAMVLFAGSQLHNTLWPSTYSSVITTADLLRFGFTVTIAVGGVLELRRIASERARLLATEKERTRRMSELAVLRADFTAMVAHELSSPLASIRAYTEILRVGDLDPAAKEQALDSVEAETGALDGLVDDVQAAAAVERDDFEVRLGPVSVGKLLDGAANFGRVLPGDHPVEVKASVEGAVWADADRIGQVLRNLVSNAAKYSPGGSTIELRASSEGGRIRFEVADRGFGIHPDDMSRIFEKFGRGRDQRGSRVPGVGLGLYLSRRIAQAHGTEFTVESKPGRGSVFAFDLDPVREDEA
ncbi:hypothetical protein BH24ACT20_BH24ACT20_01300 [soil metagenome]